MAVQYSTRTKIQFVFVVFYVTEIRSTILFFSMAVLFYFVIKNPFFVFLD